ncbi:hypothetical protein Z043_118010 [Scleropages formosus]|uniref:Uncharacterized protein n=1 Tax=Scleropages formosus TaxID=113540 RepID=A0A0P7UV83_SCLFO|nr:hypothetical protein Z043_118010 [Scleropages formosus]
MLSLRTIFDLQKDVFAHILRKDDRTDSVKAAEARILNAERDGGVLYSWKEASGITRIGKYDRNTKQHKLLYTFDEEVFISSCSLNKEENLLGKLFTAGCFESVSITITGCQPTPLPVVPVQMKL